MTTEYDKYPFIRVSFRTDECRTDRPAIGEALQKRLNRIGEPCKIMAVDCYPAVFEDDMRCAFAGLFPGVRMIHASEAMLTAPRIDTYAETFILPATVKEYIVRPCGEAEGTECATLKVFVRHHV